MSIDNMDFVPATGFRDATAYPTNPVNEAAARDQIQDGLDQIRDYINNDLIPSLLAINIPITNISGVTATEIQTALEQLKSQINGIAINDIPDGSITEVKLAFDPATQTELDAIGSALTSSINTTNTNLTNQTVGSIVYAYKNLGGGL